MGTRLGAVALVDLDQDHQRDEDGQGDEAVGDGREVHGISFL